MATFDVFNMKREKVGSIDLADEVFGAEVKEHLFYEVVKAQLASQAAGHARRQEPLGGQRQHQEALQAEGHRPRATRLDPRPASTSAAARPTRRAPRLVLRAPAPVRAQRALERALEVRQGRPPPRRRPLRARRDQDEAPARGARRPQGPGAGRSSSTRSTTRSSSSRSATARVTSFCRPRGVNVYDLLRHDTLILSKDAAKTLEERCLEAERLAQRPARRRRCAMTPEQIIRRPIILTEKATTLREKHNQVVFEVARDANKVQIKRRRAALFKVNVTDVNTMRHARQGAPHGARLRARCRTGRRRS